MDDEPRGSRRRILQLAGSGAILGLAGCVGTDPGSTGPQGTQQSTDCLEQLSDSVPESERTAPSIDGIERRPPEELSSKEDAGYVCQANDGMQCGNCRFYIDDRDDNAYGACTEVAGEVRSVDFCALWQERQAIYRGPGEEPNASNQTDGNQTDGNETDGNETDGNESSESDE